MTQTETTTKDERARGTPLKTTHVASFLKANPKPAKAMRLRDAKGLYLFLSPMGVASWRWDFKHPAPDGKRKGYTMTYGKHEHMTLADARTAHVEAQAQFRKGINPATSKTAAKKATKTEQADTIAALADLWLARANSQPDAENTKKKRREFTAKLVSLFGHLRIRDITSRALLDALRPVEAKTPVTARSVAAVAFQMLELALDDEIIDTNPAAGLRKKLSLRHEKKGRAAVTSDADIGALLCKIDAFTGSYVVGSALRLLPLVFTRPSELLGATWGEFDLDRARWDIPGKRMKMKREHIVPLSAQAIAILRDMYERAGNPSKDKILFPSDIDPRRTVTIGGLLKALDRLNKGGPKATSHGWRTTASTTLNETGKYRTAVIEFQLAHAKDAVAGAYNKAEYLTERAPMMQAYADRLDELKAIAAGQNVVALNPAKRA